MKSSESRIEKLEFIFFSYCQNLFINPTIKSLFFILIEKGYSIKLIAPKQNIRDNILDSRIKFCKINDLVFAEPLTLHSFASRFKSLYNERKDFLFLLPVKVIWRELIQHKLLKKNRNIILEFIKSNKKKFFISIDSISAYETWYAFKNNNSPKKIGFMSFEIEDWHSLKNRNENIELLKIKSDNLLNNINFLIIQDYAREILFFKNNPKPNKVKVFHIPVSSIKQNQFKPKQIKDKNNIKLLHSGSLEKWSGLYFIKNCLCNSRIDNFSLMLHTFRNSKENSLSPECLDYFNNHKNVEFLYKYIDDNERDHFIMNYDIGLAIYEKDERNLSTFGENMEQIGFSSGKFCQFMKLGLPVILKRNEFWDSLFKSYKIGYLLDDFKDWDEAIHKISEDYNSISINCLNLFNERLDPRLSTKPLLNYFSNCYQ